MPAWCVLGGCLIGSLWSLPLLAAPGPTQGDKPVAVVADRIEGVPDGPLTATGQVRAGQGLLRLEAPELRYDAGSRTLVLGLSSTPGTLVRMARARDRIDGRSGQLNLDTSTGEFHSPRFFFGSAGTGGDARLLRLLGENRMEILDASLTSCLADDRGRPLREAGSRTRGLEIASTTDLPDDPQAAVRQLTEAPPLSPPLQRQRPAGWELISPRIVLDFDRQEGTAESARVRFQGITLGVIPKLSFPLGDARRSGWLAPTVRVDTRSGLDVSAPYYLNLAPNYDATIAPTLATRRGPGAEGEFRWMLDNQAGLVQAHALPNDRQFGQSRGALYWQYDLQHRDIRVRTSGMRVSDDNYWKDFAHTATFRSQAFGATDFGEDAAAAAAPGNMPRQQPTLQPRLLGQSLQAERAWQLGPVLGSAYARVQHWQVLEGTDPNGAFVAPYQRSPQVGLQGSTALPWGLEVTGETEVNQFTRPTLQLDLTPQLRPGLRWHALTSVSRPWFGPSGWLVPKLSVNTATYRLDPGPGIVDTQFSRTIPTLSVDSGLQFERRAALLGRSIVQTLEPRVVYVNTPLRDQRSLPNFDAAAKEFNSTSIFSENAFSGIDRVSDSHQVTMGLSSRVLDARTGSELFRGSMAQRLQLRDQFTTATGAVSNQRLSDVLLAGTLSAWRGWVFDGVVQYNPDLQRTTRSVLSMQHYPGQGRAIVAAYRYARDVAETLEVRTQWPLWRSMAPIEAPGAISTGPATPGGSSCVMQVSGALRLNYNTREGKLADSLAGMELDAGCWTLRLGVQRQSTGLTEAVTRLILQFELNGLTRPRPNRFGL